MKKDKTDVTYDRFLANAMHTLKNMITPINAYVEVIQSGLMEQDKLRDIADKINYCANSAAKLSTELMNIFRVKGGLTDTRTEKINPYNLMRDYLYMIESNLQPKQIKVINQLDPDVYILCNASMLTSIFMNLLTNAIKFSPENSTITITGKCLDQDNYAISFRDEGIGIDEEKIEDKLRNNTDYSTEGFQKESGSGLGLILVKAILDRNKGSIRAYNNKDKGATFEIVLPLYKEKN